MRRHCGGSLSKTATFEVESVCRSGVPARFELTLRHLLLHPSAEIQRVGVAAIDVAGVVDRDGFDAVDLDGLQNEGHDLAVLDAADPDAGLVRRIEFVGRIVGHVENVVLVDEEAARTAELLPLQEILSVLVEDLNAVVGTVGNEEPAGRIQREAMRRVELAGPGALLAPLLDVLAVLGELHDAVVGVAAMPVGDEGRWNRAANSVARS